MYNWTLHCTVKKMPGFKHIMISLCIWATFSTLASGEDLVQFSNPISSSRMKLCSALECEAEGGRGGPPPHHLQQLHVQLGHGDSPAWHGAQLPRSVPTWSGVAIIVFFSIDPKVAWDLLADRTGEFVVVYPLGSIAYLCMYPRKYVDLKVIMA